ncbi:MAG: pseudaminic acid cytidylyltransferase [Lachnospiraceae bacterium]|nr:pseudaminic acid cytidylyltransferase [Lachnospiraceae bacterium]
MRTIAIITARGGSKRIPGKNIKEFCGQPMLAYSIKAALDSGIFDTVMVSTDDEKISDIAKKYGADVPFMRSEKTSDDHATTTDVLIEVLDEYEKRGEKYEMACCIYPTAPFLNGTRLKEAFETLNGSDADTLVPVVAFSYPPQRALVIENERLIFKYPEYLDSRSQDLQKHYHDAGQFYMFRTEAFIKNKDLLLGNIIPMELSEMEVQDIDNEVDWELAELKYQLLKKN